MALLSGRLAQGYLMLRERALGSPAAPHIHQAARLAHAVLTAGGDATPEYAAGALETSRVLLFFDGGSRGNPGPGGSGSVIIRIGGRDLSPVVMWMASVSYAARSTTNNLAEYRGLLVGLRRSLAMKLTGLHVIGDSKLILTHLAQRRPPKAAHLRDIYAQCRTIADQLQITSWTHHLRHFNKTADKLANIAMDTIRSIQVLDTDIEHLTPTWSSVIPLLTSDVSHWIETHLDPDEEGRRSNSLGNSAEDACASTFNGS